MATISIAAGDKLRITANGWTREGKHRLNNGAIYDVKGITPESDIALTNGWVLDKNFGHLAHGHVVTSHKSQGKSPDHVIIAQSAMSLPASSVQQFYVSASRGKYGLSIYTDDKQGLKQAIQNSDTPISALELVGDQPKPSRLARLKRHVLLLQRLAEKTREVAGRALEHLQEQLPGRGTVYGR